jgi:hypothetical protein
LNDNTLIFLLALLVLATCDDTQGARYNARQLYAPCDCQQGARIEARP